MNRTVLITGAARRIGAALARELARAGWNVVLHAHRSIGAADILRGELRAQGAQAWLAQGDLQLPGGADAVFDAALAAAGEIDAVVNNAARFERQPLADATPEAFDALWRLNTLAPVRLAQRLAAHTAARQAAGCVVNLLDQRIALPHSGCLPYLLSKQALATFTTCAALEWAPSGLRINAVAPGAVLTPVAESGREPAGVFPLGRRPAVRHITEAVLFLLEAESVTGQILFADGGQHLMGQAHPAAPRDSHKPDSGAHS
ncbi:MAG: SDR family oxidoreductase [Kiritimatiellia bacterium]|jgi:NAD(P)-dependent dehydrogenase (short-subunit alcohol dehydrogenase family)|nr:SDR family oxidoreductase [Kiritimatiellia bacterium]